MYIDLLLATIHNHKPSKPPTNGWILDGFPTTRSQAELLETRLTGYVEEKKGKKKKRTILDKKKRSSSIAPPQGTPIEPPEKLKSGLDIVIYLDAFEPIPQPDDVEATVDASTVDTAKKTSSSGKSKSKSKSKKKTKKQEMAEHAAAMHAFLLSRARGRIVSKDDGRVYNKVTMVPTGDLEKKVEDEVCHLFLSVYLCGVVDVVDVHVLHVLVWE